MSSGCGVPPRISTVDLELTELKMLLSPTTPRKRVFTFSDSET